MPPRDRPRTVTIDVYATRHPGKPSPQFMKSLAVDLISLYLMLEQHHAQQHDAPNETTGLDVWRAANLVEPDEAGAAVSKIGLEVVDAPSQGIHKVIDKP